MVESSYCAYCKGGSEWGKNKFDSELLPINIKNQKSENYSYLCKKLFRFP